jgi:hypothetical protein
MGAGLNCVLTVPQTINKPTVVVIHNLIYNCNATYTKLCISQNSCRNTLCHRPQDRNFAIYIHFIIPNIF